jgi:hypothetical protein
MEEKHEKPRSTYMDLQPTYSPRRTISRPYMDLQPTLSTATDRECGDELSNYRFWDYQEKAKYGVKRGFMQRFASFKTMLKKSMKTFFTSHR